MNETGMGTNEGKSGDTGEKDNNKEACMLFRRTASTSHMHTAILRARHDPLARNRIGTSKQHEAQKKNKKRKEKKRMIETEDVSVPILAIG